MLELYADECVDARIVEGLRRRNVNVITAADAGLLGASDERHLDRATELNRPIVTSDQDFLRLVATRMDSNIATPGVVFILPATAVGAAVRSITLLAMAVDAREIRNTIRWVP